MKVREPVQRPLDVVALELLLSASQAYLVGVLLYLAVGIWADRDVSPGPVAAILVLMALAVGGAWLFWLLGGAGWAMAAANVPVAIFVGFLLVLGWRGDAVVRLDSLSLLLATAAAVYGVACGAFLDSPRRWRWDQRQRPRPGTEVPRVSPATRAVAARIPRSLPKREAAPPPVPRPTPGPSPSGSVRLSTELLASSRASGLDAGDGAGEAGPAGEAGSVGAAGEAAVPAEARQDATGARERSYPLPTRAPRVIDRAAPAPGSSPAADGGPGRGRATRPSTVPAEAGPIELPTSVEPKAQRSPWAWAAPPEWNRDEDDLPPGGASSGL